MLPREFRMHRSTDFTTVVRSGSRARHGGVVVHQRRELHADAPEPMIGLIVSKAVGTSVVRHRVSRRLRAQVAARLDALPASSGTVVRALPGSADAPSHQLGRDLDRAFAALGRPR